MKKVLFSMLFLLAGMQFGMAQERHKFKPVEEKTKDVMLQMQSLKLNDSATAKVSAIFTTFYESQQQIMRNYRNAENPDREAALTAMKKIGEDRDDSLKKILTDEQYKKYLSDIQPQITVNRQRGNQ